ncbi:TATA element modulatory factor 1 DNA binding [Parasponia andersonii]|uniref:TATA element modulatory factor 1 DNA binding n=1 Tax=Parasponia andersonii TaxID=3476 RepID=A0A2P5A5I6_PARAD|nr:TATA element modulatory factor 1 DNA binding [Parasponia andersonii]
MAWFSGKVSLGNFADIAGAVNKIQESVKNIEKNFDSALGFDEKDKEKAESSNEAPGLWTSSTVMAFMGHKNVESNIESSEKPGSLNSPEVEKSSRENVSPERISTSEEHEGAKTEISSDFATEQTAAEEESEVVRAEETDEHSEMDDGTNAVLSSPEKPETVSPLVASEPSEEHAVENLESSDSVENQEKKEMLGVEALSGLDSVQESSGATEVDQGEGTAFVSDQSHNLTDVHENMHEQKAEVDSRSIDEKENTDEQKAQVEESIEIKSPVEIRELIDTSTGVTTEPSVFGSVATEESDSAEKSSGSDFPVTVPSNEASVTVPELVANENNAINNAVGVDQPVDHKQNEIRGQHLKSGTNASDSRDSALELERMKMEMKMMESALQGAARQAQSKADEIAKLMNENEQLKVVIEDLKRKPSDAEVETLREEYHQRVATLERKVYALTKERDNLRREQNKKSDAAALLKEKDEIINQVMAEGEELSKKQAAQEAQMRKLRAQIRELEEEKKGLITKLQVEENKVESIKRDKTATEKLLQETIERHQSELAFQKEYYTNALNAAKEAEALAEARANNEARSELESRLREAEERDSMLVQALEELRQTLSRKEQQAVFREDIHRRDIEDLQKRYQASERRCEELITQVPDSTRPLLRQIEAMQDTNARRAEAWAAVERNLNSRLQEAEAKAATAEERERSVNKRLSQTLSRINVLEAQISCLRAEQTQLSKSLEKERQRAAENRQEYLVAKEEADTLEGRANQLEEAIRELKRKHKQELQESLTHRELLQQEIEKEKAARFELERKALVHSAAISDQTPTWQHSAFENGNLRRKLSSASSLGSMEESYYLQASLDSSDSLSERRNAGEATMSPYYMKSMTPGAFEAALRQKEGELASYMSRLATMESIRDSLAEELVQMTEQCEKLRAEAATLPGIRAELESLRRRHSAALELMGERDEELEELRADIIDLKEMYREQVNLLVNKIQIMSSSVGNS